MQIRTGKVGRALVDGLGRVGAVAKAVAAAVGGLVTALTPVFADDVLGLDEIETVIAAIAAAVGTVYAVWRVPNRAPQK